MSSRFSDVHALVRPQSDREPTPFDGILEQTRELMSVRLEEAIAGMLDKADEALFALMRDTYNREESAILEEARDIAVKQRDLIENGFRERYQHEFRQRSNRARRIGRAADQVDVPLVDLELVDDEDLEETLKFNDMAAKLRDYCEDELTALDQRVGVLLGDADLQAKDNPFSPQVICDAYKHACRGLEAAIGVRRALLRLFDDHVLDDVRSVYKAVNALLVRNAILPKIRYNVGRTHDRAAAPGADIPADVTQGDGAAGQSNDLFALLQRLAAASGATAARTAPGGNGIAPGAGGVAVPVLHGAVVPGAGVVPFLAQAGPSGGDGASAAARSLPADGEAGAAMPIGGVAILPGPELLGSLTRLQQGDYGAVGEGARIAWNGEPGTTNILHRIKDTSVGAGMTSLDMLTLDIIAMLFDQLFDDPKVPNGIKGLIGRLQIPMLKVAIADKTFFSNKTNPARRLFDTVGEIALRLPTEFDSGNPLFGRLQDLIQEVVDGFQDDDGIFVVVSEKLVALMDEEDKRIVAEKARPAARKAEEMENLAHARAAAQAEIRARVHKRELPEAVRDFLAQQWIKLLILAHVKEGKDGRAWTCALEVIDRLIWSLEPKSTKEDRQRLGTLIPNLLVQLAAGMKSAGVEDAVRERFFAELMTHHARAIRPTNRPEPIRAAEPALSVAATLAAGPAAVAPAPAAAAGESDSLDFTAPIRIRNPYGEGEVSVDNDLDFTDIAKGAQARREDSIRRAMDTLKVGTWVEFGDSEDPTTRRAARLIFVSPRKTRYLFAADPACRDIIQCTSAEIGRRLRTGEAVRLPGPPDEPLFDRIMGGLLRKLRPVQREPAFAH